MRTVATVVVVAVLLAGTASFGAVITFGQPAYIGYSFVDLNVSITGSEKFGAFDAIFQSNALDLENSVWTPAIAWDAIADNELYLTGAPHERWLGGAMTSVSRYVGPSVLLGTLRIPVAALPGGQYSITVDGATDGISAVGYLNGADPLSGSCVFSVPAPVEPTTVGLLAIGGLLAARRRRGR